MSLQWATIASAVLHDLQPLEVISRGRRPMLAPTMSRMLMMREDRQSRSLTSAELAMVDMIDRNQRIDTGSSGGFKLGELKAALVLR